MRAWKFIAVFSLATVCLFGCTSGPRYQRPVFAEELAVPPADDPRWGQPTPVPEKKIGTGPLPRTSVNGPGGAGPGGGGGGVGGPSFGGGNPR